jgi:hypothetical protein
MGDATSSVFEVCQLNVEVGQLFAAAARDVCDAAASQPGRPAGAESGRDVLAGGSLNTSTPPMLNRQTEPARLYAHSP